MIERRSILRYSEAFKLQVVREIESGKYGILKLDSCLDMKFENLEQAKKAVKQAINAYNNNRPHWGLNLNVPNKIYCVN